MPTGYGIPASGATVTVAPTSKTTVAPPVGAHACILSTTTQNVWVTFDGSTPSATNGLLLLSSAGPLFLPIATGLTFLNAVSGGIVNICWLA